MTAHPRKAGEFCWFNMMTPQPDKARDFFADLLGWTYRAMPNDMGHVAQVNGEQIGGVFNVVSPQTPNGMEPFIGVMVQTDDADALSASARRLGGKGGQAEDIGPAGRMAELADPAGAKIDLWQPKMMGSMTADPNAHGAPSWFETLTHDAKTQREFYTKLFGWTADVTPMAGGEYTTFSLGGGPPMAGMMELRPEWGPMPPHWRVYFTVNDVDATAAKCQSSGGRVIEPPVDIPGIGRYAGLSSPQGVMFEVIKYAPRA